MKQTESGLLQLPACYTYKSLKTFRCLSKAYFFSVKTSTIFHLSQPCVGGEARQVYPCACIFYKWCLGDNALVFIWQRRGYGNGGGMFQNVCFAVFPLYCSVSIFEDAEGQFSVIAIYGFRESDRLIRHLLWLWGSCTYA